MCLALQYIYIVDYVRSPFPEWLDETRLQSGKSAKKICHAQFLPGESESTLSELVYIKNVW